MSTNNIKAVKHDEVLSEIEAGLVVQGSDIKEETVEPVAEETAQEDSATTEEQTAKEEEAKPVEETTEAVEEDLTEEEQSLLADKTKRQMTRLREEARKVKELEAEIESLKKTQESRKPLEEAKVEYVQEERNPLPWETTGLTAQEAKRLAREEIDRERRVSQIGIDAELLEGAHAELNPSSDEYSPELAEDIYTTFKVQFLRDESVRLRDIAEKKLEVIRKIKERMQQQQEEDSKLSKQEAEQAPPVSVAKPKSTVDVATQIGKARTLAELEAFEQQLGKAR